MNQQEALSQITVRGVYRHTKTKKLFHVAGYGFHAVNKVTKEGAKEEEEKESEVDVILSTATDEPGEGEVKIIPVLLFVKPNPDGSARFERVT